MASKQEERASALKRRKHAPQNALLNGLGAEPPPIDALVEAVTARVMASLEPKLAELRIALANLALHSTRRSRE